MLCTHMLFEDGCNFSKPELSVNLRDEEPRGWQGPSRTQPMRYASEFRHSIMEVVSFSTNWVYETLWKSPGKRSQIMRSQP